MELSQLNALVTARNDLCPGLMTMRVAPDGWDFPEFEAGQYVSLGLFGSEPDKLIKRPYSIVSPPESRDSLEFYINLVPSGVLTPRLFHLRPGDRIWLSSKISGFFTLKSVTEDANLILIATGTGLAPYVSMLQSRQALATRRNIALIHGVRESRQLAYRSLFEALQQERPDFTYLPVVSRPQLEISPWAGATGHVQDVWSGGAIERAWGFPPSPAHTHVLLCGNPEMIQSMIAILARDGFQEQTPRQPGQVHSEKYWR